MPAGGLLSLGIGAAAKGILGFVQNEKAGQVHPQYFGYTPSTYAKNQLGTAQQLFGGRMAGAGAEEQNIQANQANQEATVARNATDGSQALAADAATQGTTNSAFRQLQTQEDQNKYQMLNNLNMGDAAMTAEGDKQYQSQLQKYQMDLNMQNQLRQAGITNMYGAATDVSQMPMIMAMIGQLKRNGGMGGIAPAAAPAAYNNPAQTMSLLGGGMLM